jgi:hypothetical protein
MSSMAKCRESNSQMSTLTAQRVSAGYRPDVEIPGTVTSPPATKNIRVINENGGGTKVELVLIWFRDDFHIATKVSKSATIILTE